MRTQVIHIYGIVQGVGFRPFVSRLAMRLGVKGSVANKGSFVEVHAQGEDNVLMSFQRALEIEAPPRSAILKLEAKEREEAPFLTFDIVESQAEEGQIFVSPDIAICDACRQELYDSHNRRYLHPFINCTACGPRLTILDAMPYDRERTSMGIFPMCAQCKEEYTHAETRRYDAQPVCCHDCGPQVYLLDKVGKRSEVQGIEAIMVTRRLLREGKIVAVKGIGGVHLACDARNEEAVQRLRRLKRRPMKPFAVMFKSLADLERDCEATTEQRELLEGPQKPIILLKRRRESTLAAAVAPGNPMVGAFLPYAPVQLLLFDCRDGLPMTTALVMTSGNVSGAPICRSDEEARNELWPFCDVILSHDRRIRLRADDSVTDFFEGKPYMIRRSRGYAPLPVCISHDMTSHVLGIGGELKNCFCLGRGNLFYLSPYIGNMEDMRTVEALKESVAQLASLLETKPACVVCDLHPKYNSVMVAEELGLPVMRVQHHYAHILSCMAENDCLEDVIGVSFDGTGYGPDGTIWGGEILCCGVHGFVRQGHIPAFWQPGGDASSREGWRIAVSLLDMLYPGRVEEMAAWLGVCKPQEASMIKAMIEHRVNTVQSTSAGRLFDGVAALLGIRRVSTFEGEAAMALQFQGEQGKAEEHDNQEENDLVVLVKTLIGKRLAGEKTEKLAYAFHSGLAAFVEHECRRARELTSLKTVALSGGVFQNTLLLSLCVERLRQAGFRVLLHSQVPPNDGGIALGQALFGALNN